jgi:hypothetical protein
MSSDGSYSRDADYTPADLAVLTQLIGDAADVVSTSFFESSFRTVEDASGQHIKLTDRAVQPFKKRGTSPADVAGGSLTR